MFPEVLVSFFLRLCCAHFLNVFSSPEATKSSQFSFSRPPFVHSKIQFKLRACGWYVSFMQAYDDESIKEGYFPSKKSLIFHVCTPEINLVEYHLSTVKKKNTCSSWNTKKSITPMLTMNKSTNFQKFLSYEAAFSQQNLVVWPRSCTCRIKYRVWTWLWGNNKRHLQSWTFSFFGCLSFERHWLIDRPTQPCTPTSMVKKGTSHLLRGYVFCFHIVMVLA